MIEKPTKYSLPNESNILRATLANGITALVYENPNVQSVVVAGALDAGSLFESPQQNGLSAMVAGALERGTTNRDFDTLHTILEENAADLHVGAGKHKTRFGGKALAEDFPLLVELLADTLRNPAFTEIQVERLRGEWLTGLQYREQDTSWQASRSFRETLYPVDHPYHYGSQGTLDTIPKLTIDDLRQFHTQHYGPQRMIIVVVGAINATFALDTVKRNFADWDNSAQKSPITLPELPTMAQPRRTSVIVPGKYQANIIIGSIGPSRFDPDYRPANLANSILGQFGMMGRIGEVVREREGLAYYAGSQINGGHGPGSWTINAGVDPADVERAIALCLEEIERITTEPVSDDDLTDNQSYYIGRLPLQLENNEGLAGAILTIEMFQLGLNYLLNYRDIILELTKTDLLRATQRFLSPESLVISVAGPGNQNDETVD